jgi:soluble lytic murein transglycosylase-like protein
VVGSSAAIQSAFGPQGPGAVAWANRVSACESGGSATAQNPSGATGLFQFMPSTWAHLPWAGQSVFDPVANAQAAAYYYQHSGPGPWSCK